MLGSWNPDQSSLGLCKIIKYVCFWKCSLSFYPCIGNPSIPPLADSWLCPVTQNTSSECPANREASGWGRGWGDKMGINKTLVKELVWTLWHHWAFYSGSQRVLFLNELKSHLPLSCSIHQATSREFLTWNYLFAYTTSWAQFHVWDIYLKAPLIYYLFLSGNPFSNSPSPLQSLFIYIFIYLALDFFA